MGRASLIDSMFTFCACECVCVCDGESGSVWV